MSFKKQSKLHITINSRSVLRLCHNYSWLTLFDITPSIFKNYKYAQQVLRKLCNEKHLFKVTCPLFQTTRGAGMNFYSLDLNGYRALNGSGTGFKKRKVPTSTHFLHHYISNFFLTGMKNLFNESVTTLTEREVKDKEAFYLHFLNNQTPFSSTSFAIPDFAFLIKSENSAKLFLGEVDTETENITSTRYGGKSIEEKFVSFSYYFENGIHDFFSQKFDHEIDGFTYLHITTGSKERVSSIFRVCEKLNPSMPVMITSANKLYPVINYDHHRIAHVDYSPLVNGLWLDYGSRSLKTLKEVL